MKVLSDTEFLDQHFFVISSENCKEVKSKLYGYAFFEDNIYMNNENFGKEIPKDAIGCYVNVIRNGNIIKIQQDYYGMYKLYMYQKDEFFAVSNSFVCLVNYLKDLSLSLSLNGHFAKYFICEELASLVIEETLVKEIRLVPRKSMLFIDSDLNELSIIDEKIDTIPCDIDTREGMGKLDKWHSKWSSFIATLVNNGENVWVALSGGMDSRAAFAPFVSNDVDLKKITVFSIKDDLHTHSEDFKIATKISEALGFTLNKEIYPNESFPVSSALSSIIENYVRLGVHSETGFLRSVRTRRRFFFGGSGGENLRNHWNMSVNEFIQRAVNRDKYYSLDAKESIKKCLNASIEVIRKNNTSLSDEELLNELYVNSRMRNHFGSGIVRGIIGNNFELATLMDPLLAELNMNVFGNSDRNLLFALIYERYCKPISHIEFDSNRKIDEKTVALAKKINAKFPYTRDNSLSKRTLKIVDNPVQYLPAAARSASNPYSDMIAYFNSDGVRTKICALLGEEVYNRAKQELFTVKFHPERLCFKLLAIVMVYDAIAQNKKNQFAFEQEKIERYYSPEKLISGFFDFCKKARIDIKNFGSKNSDINIVAEENNKRWSSTSPAWFTNDKGKGYVITSNEGKMDIILKCINDGTLQFYFRGIDFRCSGERYPLWIDYTSVIIDGVRVFDAVQPAWHDKPVQYTMPVKNGQAVKVHIEWQPHGYTRKEFIELVEKFFENPVR